MVKLQILKGRGFLTVPKDKLKRLSLKAGDEFDVDITDSNNLIFIRLNNNIVPKK